MSKVLEREDPSVIPVEMPDKFYLHLNLNTAKSIYLEISPEVVRMADRVFQ